MKKISINIQFAKDWLEDEIKLLNKKTNNKEKNIKSKKVFLFIILNIAFEKK